MTDLRHAKSVIIVFAMAGCPACHEYLPKLTQMIAAFQAHGIPFLIYEHGPIYRGQIPVLIYDGGSQDPGVVALADQHQIQALPTTILLTHNAPPVRLEGALDDAQIHGLLAAATYANR